MKPYIHFPISISHRVSAHLFLQRILVTYAVQPFNILGPDQTLIQRMKSLKIYRSEIWHIRSIITALVTRAGPFHSAALGATKRCLPAKLLQPSIWYFIRIPISYCKSSTYTSWGPHKTWNIIQNDISIDKNSSRTELHIFKKVHTAYISMHTHKLSRSNRGEARCCFICFLKPGLLFIWAVWDWRMFHAIRALYNTVRFLEFVLDLGTVKRPLVG
jgi:hypothetical protein